MLELTIDSECSGLAEPATGGVLGAAGVVAHVSQATLVDDEIALIGNDEVDLFTDVNIYTVLQPEYLKQSKHQICNIRIRILVHA